MNTNDEDIEGNLFPELSKKISDIKQKTRDANAKSKFSWEDRKIARANAVKKTNQKLNKIKERENATDVWAGNLADRFNLRNKEKRMKSKEYFKDRSVNWETRKDLVKRKIGKTTQNVANAATSVGKKTYELGASVGEKGKN